MKKKINKIKIKINNKLLMKIGVYTWLVSFLFVLINLFLRYLLVKVLIGLIVVIIVYKIIRYWLNNRFLTSQLSLYNVHIFGKKRRGKDLSMQLAIYKRYHKQYNKIIKKQPDYDFNEKPLYLSNIDYGYGCRLIDLKELQIIDNKTKKMITYQDIIDGSYKDMEIIKNEMFEGLDLYISDAQLGLPNTEHNMLDRLYPWLPVFIALSGQLYNMLVTINTQEYERLWIKLRNQQDSYIVALNTTPMNKSYLQKIWKKIPILKKYIFVRLRYYDNQNSAINNVLPFNAKAYIDNGAKTLHVGAGQAIKEQFEATNGIIKEFTVVMKISKIKYDSRIFHEYIFGYKYE